LQHYFFYFVLEKWFSIEERFQPLHWSGCHRSIETYKPPSTNIYPEFCDALTQVLKKQVTNPKCIWFHLGHFFLALHYEVQTVVTNWNALHAEKQKHNSRRSQCCWVLIGMHFRLNTRRNIFIEVS
jgi:hypothetical protein